MHIRPPLCITPFKSNVPLLYRLDNGREQPEGFPCAIIADTLFVVLEQFEVEFPRISTCQP